MTKKIHNRLFLDALALKPTSRVPLWVMRQAGRYLPEYREVRKKADSFLNLCRDAELAATVTLQPIKRFELDAAIVFSDILTIPEAFNLGLAFTDGEGPRLQRPLQDEDAVNSLAEFDLEKIAYLTEVIQTCSNALDGQVPLIGFAGGPYTLACYMIEGKGGEFLHARALAHSRPDLFLTILEKNAKAVAQTLLLQANAGADVLMIFDSWAGLVPAAKANEYLAKPLALVMQELKQNNCDLPVICFWRNACAHADLAINTGINCLGVDWLTDMAKLSQEYGDKVALQGNLDPAILLTDAATIKQNVKQVLNSHQAKAGHIFNLGHGIDKRTPVANMQVLAESVRQFSVND